MARKARLKMDEIACCYHICARMMGEKSGYFPLAEDEVQRKLIEIIKFYGQGFQCEVVGFCIMGNHYHLILQFRKEGKLSEEFLKKMAYAFYPKSKMIVDRWHKADWVRFEKRLFNLSEFMKSVQRAFTVWYNKKKDRRGSFWAERFKSNILRGKKSILECLLYVDLNPVRAGLVTHPEDYEGSSCFLRLINKDSWLMPLQSIIGKEGKKKKVLQFYRAYLYKRGSLPTKPGAQAIPKDVYDKMAKRDFKDRGVYLKKLSYFTNGLMIGSKTQIKDYLEKLKAENYYQRRQNPILTEGGEFRLKGDRGG